MPALQQRTQRPTILITGAGGLVGCVVHDLLQLSATCLTPSSRELDLLNEQAVLEFFEAHPVDAVIHLAAYTDVSAAWQQRGDTTGSAYQINVIGTRHVAQAAQGVGAHMIQISTAYVFDGNKETRYVESDAVSPIEWYGQTKAEAEHVVQSTCANWSILRIDQPFRLAPFKKLDIAHRIALGLRAGTLHPQFTDHFFGPTIIEDFAKIVQWAVSVGPVGLLHASSGEKWSDYDFATLIGRTLQLPFSIERGSLALVNKPDARPYQKNTAMSSDLLRSKIDFQLRNIADTIPELRLPEK